MSGRRWIVTAAFAVASVGLTHVLATRVADALAAEAAAGVDELGCALAAGAQATDDEVGGPTIDDLIALGDPATVEIPRGIVERVALPAAPLAQRQGRAPPALAAEPPLGILVRASVVRAAIARGGRPSGAPVAAEGPRPAGLVLHGVSGYGTALRDGDVLVRVGGTPATSEGRVIAAVSGAVRSRARAIDGEVWRAGRRIPVVVELPRFGRKKGARRPD